jgi:hypothetical protein
MKIESDIKRIWVGKRGVGSDYLLEITDENDNLIEFDCLLGDLIKLRDKIQERIKDE